MKVLKRSLLLSLAVFALASCKQNIYHPSGSSDGSRISDFTGIELEAVGSDITGKTPNENLYTPTKEKTITYKKTSPITELSIDDLTLKITGLEKGQKIYLTKINPNADRIYGIYTQYVKSAQNVTLSEAEEDPPFKITGMDTIRKPTAVKNLYNVVPDFASFKKLNSTAARTVVTKNVPVTQLDISTAQIGKLQKKLYIDADSNLITFKSANATLRAIGKKCNVWVVNGYYYTDDATSYTFNDNPYYSSAGYKTYTNEQLTLADVQKIANQFDLIYDHVRAIFGEESDEIFYSVTEDGESFNIKPMNYLSDTGTKVNIVIYDIGQDFDKETKNGILGYFYSKDYYPNENDLKTISNLSYGVSPSVYSNEGKYFYLDAPSFKDEHYAETIYSTLAHEFQHMVAFGEKYVEQGVFQEAYVAEMMSMLCEDFLMTPLNTKVDDSPIARLPSFNKNLNSIGVEYNSDYYTATVLSYAMNYAFGAWLVRNYGGKELATEMAKNKYGDYECITAAVKTVSGKSMSMEDLLLAFSQSCIFSKNLSGYNLPATFNKAVNDSTYPLMAIDLWNLDKTGYLTVTDYSQSLIDAGFYKFDGPQLLGYNAQTELRPYGINLVDVGTVTQTGDVTINFGNICIDKNQKLYLMIE